MVISWLLRISWDHHAKYPLVNIYITMERSTILVTPTTIIHIIIMISLIIINNQ